MRDNGEANFFRPAIEARLPMRKGEQVFTIGSCFARNVDTFLAPHFHVPSHVRISDVPADIAAMHADLTANLTIWHRYNVFSIRNSFQWALMPGHPSARHRVFHLASDRSVDPHAGCYTILPTPDALRVRDWIDSTMATVRNCRIIILTLSLSEVWEDRETGLIMNGMPRTEMWQAFPDRFKLRVLSCADTVKELNCIHDILSRHCVDGFQIVATVSPQPLLATFREMDVVVANAASKATVRAAIDQWASEHDNVHYFPSYEMIINSSSHGTWLDDYRHCTIETIKKVMDVFLTDFVYLEN